MKTNGKLKTLLFSTVLLISSTLSAFSQNVTLEFTRTKISEVLSSIKSQTKMSLIYSDQVVDVNRLVSINVKDATIEQTLAKLFSGTSISYEISNNKIYLMPAKAQQEINNKKNIKGVVKDATGEPIIGASVTDKNNPTNGTITDIDGNFTINTEDNSVLVVSYMGYVSQDLSTKGLTSLNVILKEDAKVLDEVVVVGYGTQKKVNLTGAVSSVKMDDVLGNRPVSSALSALESTVPGLQINKASGKPGVSVNANIRGVTSINGGSPLVLVDNVPMSLDLVDPNDIETISVLKDAAASAIYGARAAFGVILVTTKTGKKDAAPKVNYSNNFSFSNIASKYKMVTPGQTLNYLKDMGVGTYWSGQDLNKWMDYLDEYENQGLHTEGHVWGEDGYRYNLAQTDAYKDMLEKTGFQQTHNLAVQGGSSHTSYRLSFGMVNEDGILVTDKDKYSRYNVSGFISSDATSWLTAQLDTKYTTSEMSTATGYGIWSSIGEMMSMTPLGYGTQTKDGTEQYPFTTPRHLIELSEPNINRISNIRLLGRLVITPLKGWNITGEYTYNRNWTSGRVVNKYIETIDPMDLRISKYNATTSYSMENTFNVRNVMNIFSTYQHTFNKIHSISLMGGFNQEEYHYEMLKGTRKDLVDQDLPSLGLATGDMVASDGFNELALRSLFFRVNYSYKDRYLVEANGRYDGSSRFPKHSRFGFFPSFSAAWRVSEEPFMTDTKKYIDNVKLRLSWGNIGNQNTSGYYPYLSTIDTNFPKWILPGTTDWVTSFTTPGLVSNSLTWEKVSTLNFGLDLMLLNCLNMTVEYYIRDTKNMLGPSAPLPSVLGTGAPRTNVASLRTKGWEINLEYNKIVNKNLSYRLGFNLYDSRTEITEYYDSTNGLLTSGGKQQLRKGMKYGEIWGYQTDRYLTADDFNSDGTIKPGIPLMQGQKVVYPGDIIFVDRDLNGEISVGDNTIDNPGDQVIIGNRTPRFQYGITGGIQFKDFDLSVFFNGIGKRDMWIPLFPSNGSYVKGIQEYQLDYWTPENPDAFFPRISEKTSTGSNYNMQTKYVRNGAYFRMKNITLGYNVPKIITSKVLIQNLRLFFSAENLFTLHHLPDGYMPDAFDTSVGSLSTTSETSGDSKAGIYTYPLMRQFSFGLNVTF